MTNGTGEKRPRKPDDDDSNSLTHGNGNPPQRKKKLYDAFQSLSLQTSLLKNHVQEEATSKQAMSRIPDEDACMKDPSSFQKDAYTIVVNSLEDELDTEAQEDEPKFLFALPGAIDTTFSGTKAIPESLLNRQRFQNNELVLYRGRADEIISRSLDGKDNRIRQAGQSERLSFQGQASKEVEDQMQVD